jgi:hypothetical protein
MRKALLATIAVLAILGAPAAQPAYADPPPTGGAAHDPNPRPLTAAERRAFAEKQVAFEKSKAFILSRRDAHGRVTVASSGSVWTDIFEEPQNEPGSYNWCGPGSTTAVVTNWNNNPYNYNGTYGTGPIAYMKWLALEGAPGIGPMIQYDIYGNPITFDTRLRDTVNNQTSSLFYWIQNPVGGLTNFISYVNSDLNGFDQGHHPLYTVVWTANLPGWGTWTTRHWQWVVAFDDGANFLEYGDSAGPNACQPSCLPNGPIGWHTSVTLSDYYNHIADPNVYDEIVW